MRSETFTLIAVVSGILGLLLLLALAFQVVPPHLTVPVTVGLSFPTAIVMAWAIFRLIVYQAPTNTAGILMRGKDFAEIVPPGEMRVVVRPFRRVAKEIALKHWDVPVTLPQVYTEDKIPVQCSLYVRYTLRPWESAAEVQPEFKDFKETVWQQRVQRIVHDALLRLISAYRWRQLTQQEGLNDLAARLVEAVQEPLRYWGVRLTRVEWQFVQPVPGLQKTLERLQEARSQGQAISQHLREISRRFRLSPESIEELLMLALTATLSREGQPNLNITLHVPEAETREEPPPDDGAPT